MYMIKNMKSFIFVHVLSYILRAKLELPCHLASMSCILYSGVTYVSLTINMSLYINNDQNYIKISDIKISIVYSKS